MREMWVDYSKGIGIILVVFGHVNRGLYSAGIYLSESIYNLTDSVIYSFHMPLFFFLSGLFFASSLDRKGKKQFIISKIDTIVYPYIIWSLLQGSIGVALSHYTNTPSNLNDLFSLFTHPQAQFWFLYALFMVFIVATVLYKKDKFHFILPILIVLSIGLYIFQSSITNSFHLDYITNYMVFFLFGSLAIRYSQTIASINVGTTVAMLCVLVLLEWIFHGYLGLRYTDAGFFSLLIALIAISFIVCFSVLLARTPITWLRRLGELSMVIYLMHIIAGSGVRIVLAKFLHIDNWLVHAVVGVLFGLLLPIAAFYIIQRLHINFLLECPKGLWPKHKSKTS